MGATPLVQAVESFLSAASWEASRAVVAAEPQLLDADAQDVLRELAQRARDAGDDASADLLEQHRVVLDDARRGGISTAFAELVDDEQDLAEILAELSEPPASQADLPWRAELCRAALALVSRDENRELWALLQASLGTSLMMSTVGDRAECIEQAIAALDAAATEFAEQGLWIERARTLNNLGLALESRLTGTFADDDLERAIAAFHAALDLLTDPEVAQERAETLNNLANAYNRRQSGRRDENRERAILLYEEALALGGEQGSPAWVKTRLNLGVALLERFEGDWVQNVDRAITAFEAGLACTDPATDPMDWASLHANLGNAYARRGTATGDDDLQRAIVEFEAALETYGDVRASLNRALTLSNLANVLLEQRTPGRDARVERAIACYLNALDILDPETSPLDWAVAQNNLGRAYRERPGGDRAENLELAIEAFEKAVERMSPRNDPVFYAQVLKNLGTAYRRRTIGARDENLLRAIRAYDEALAIRSAVYGPDHPRVASVLYSLAKAQKAAGEREAARRSLERALAIDEASRDEPARHLARGYRSLATMARELGDLTAAERAIERALELDEQRLGPDHADVFSDLRELALIRDLQGRPEGALQALERAVKIDDLSPLGASAGVREALGGLAELLRKAGDLAGAQATMERAVALDEELFGPEHPRVAESLAKLGDLLREAQDVTGARDTLERAAEIERATRGAVGPYVAAALATLASVVEASHVPAPRGLDIVEHAPSKGLPGTPVVRLRYRERLAGRIALADDPRDAPPGRRSTMRLDLRLQIVIDDLERFMTDPGYSAAVTGEASCPQLGGERTICHGEYSIEFDPDRKTARTIAYALDLGVHEEAGYLLRGTRRIDEDADGDLLRAALSLPVLLTTAAGQSLEGVVSVGHLDMLEQLAAAHVEAPTTAARMAAVDRFARAAFGPLWDHQERRDFDVSTAARPAP